MANVISKNPGTVEFGGTPYGNTQNRHFVMATSATGALLSSNSGTAIGIGDTIVLGPLRAGMRLDDALAIISVALRATTTGNLGFVYADGVDDTDAAALKEGRTKVLQDAAYFFTALAGTAGRTRMSQSKQPVTLPKDANLVWTNGVIAQNALSRVDFLIYGEDRGAL